MDYDYRALIGKWHVSKQSMTQPLVSFFFFWLFLVHFFHRPGNNCLFFQSDFFSARLGIALEVGKAKEETHSESREAKKKCAVFSTSKGIFDEKQSKTKTHKISKKEKKDLHIV